ncbi:EAL domain-containing protein [Paenibacillus sp. GCM10027628]|uniref:EAL domain-containing protein n=1 Tax=Paenibacillus sp. GCM10027628 TaxID=3273413 RepID=UPI00363E1C82
MITFATSIVLYIIPIVLLLHMAVEVYQRNPYGGLNKIASTFFVLTVVLIVSNFVVRIVPPVYESRVILWLYYFPAFILMSVALHFCIRMTGRFQSLPKWLLLVICYGPVALGSMLFFPLSWISVEIIESVTWKYERNSKALELIMLGSSLYTTVTGLLLVAAGFHYVKTYDLNLKRKQIRTIFLGSLAANIWQLLFFFYQRLPFLPAYVHYPDLGLFSFLWFAWFLKKAMTKYDFLPSIDRNYQQLYDLSPLSILVINQDGMIKDLNPQAAQLLERSPSELLGLHIEQILAAEAGNSATGLFCNEITQWVLQGKYALVTSSGKVKHVKVEIQHMESQGDLLYYIVLTDTTQKKAAEERVSILAYFDTVTGIGNRLQYINQMNTLLTQGDPPPFAIMLVKVEDCNPTNDITEPDAGNRKLQHIADRLRKYAPESALITRSGCDEFALILPDIVETYSLATLAGYLITNLEEPMISASVGICTYPEHGLQAEELQQAAELAMYQAKKQGMNQIVVYEKSNQNVKQDASIKNFEIRKALDDREFILYYQPQIEIHSGRILGVEALIRWIRPGIGLLSPNEFIGTAEKTGLLADIDQWVLDTACKQLQTWMEDGMQPLVMSVNCSAQLLFDPGFPERLAETLRRTGLDPACLCLEITEITVMYGNNDIMSIYRSILELGVKLSIDDYGSGSMAMGVIEQIGVDSIKIDRSFTNEMHLNDHEQKRVRTIIARSHLLGQRVIAKGVENYEQWEMLSLFGCDEIQGYFLSRPLEAREFVRFMHQKLFTA